MEDNQTIIFLRPKWPINISEGKSNLYNFLGDVGGIWNFNLKGGGNTNIFTKISTISQPNDIDWFLQLHNTNCQKNVDPFIFKVIKYRYVHFFFYLSQLSFICLHSHTLPGYVNDLICIYSIQFSVTKYPAWGLGHG